MNRKRNDKRGSVYFIGDGIGHVKIGQTRNLVEGRLYDLQTGNALPLKIMKKITVPIYELNDFEFGFHALFADKRIKTTKESEWFNDSDFIMMNVQNLRSPDIRECLMKYGKPITDEVRVLWLEKFKQINKSREQEKIHSRECLNRYAEYLINKEKMNNK